MYCNYNIYAHRGNAGSQVHDENQMDNSIEAVKVSITRPYVYGFEFDFRLTKDKQLIVTHDKDIKHISGPKPENIVQDILRRKDDRKISEMTLEELREEQLRDIFYYYWGLKQRARFLPDSKKLISIIEAKLDSKAEIPTADAMLEYIARNNPSKELLLELKENTRDCANALSDLINKYKSVMPITAHGYDEKLMQSIKEQTGVKTGILVNPFQTGIIGSVTKQPDRLADEYIKSQPYDFWSVVWCYLNAHQVITLMENGKGINAWTIDSLMHLKNVYSTISNVEKLYGSTPDNVGIITNVPDLIHEYDENRKARK